MSSRGRIGLICSLTHYLTDPFWLRFFEHLGFRVVTREPPRHDLPPLLNRFENELCLPVKYALGQVELLRQLDIDMLFAPLVYSLQKSTYVCPKIIMIPDLIRLYFDPIPPLLSPRLLLYYQTGRYAGFRDAALTMQDALGCDSTAIYQACAEAEAADREHSNQLRRTRQLHDELLAGDEVPKPAPGSPRLLVLGHRYSVHNRVLANDLPRLMRRIGFDVVTKEQLSYPALGVNTRVETGLDTDVFFSEGADIYRAAFYGGRSPRFDAVAYLAMFNCGFDAIIEDVIQRRILKGADKPYLYLLVDEHATRSNTQTRLEVFYDVVTGHRLRAGGRA